MSQDAGSSVRRLQATRAGCGSCPGLAAAHAQGWLWLMPRAGCGPLDELYVDQLDGSADTLLVAWEAKGKRDGDLFI